MNSSNKKENINFFKSELKKTELLLEINKKIAGLKNLSEILWTIIDFVTENVGGDRGSLFLNDSETNELYSRVAQGELTREIRILNTVGIAGAIFTSQKGEIIHDVYSDKRFNFTGAYKLPGYIIGHIPRPNKFKFSNNWLLILYDLSIISDGLIIITLFFLENSQQIF